MLVVLLRKRQHCIRSIPQYRQIYVNNSTQDSTSHPRYRNFSQRDRNFHRQRSCTYLSLIGKNILIKTKGKPNPCRTVPNLAWISENVYQRIVDRRLEALKIHQKFESLISSGAYCRSKFAMWIFFFLRRIISHTWQRSVTQDASWLCTVK